ncbi:MAG: hypothetical protein K0R63_1111 [Rickettsiales bacterium]|jgi:invasion protein IalB|nr:hypothetical protein [Rickettsiales bacterium]
MRYTFSLLAAALYLFISMNAANAQEFDRNFEDWSVYTITQNGKKVCYIASSPREKKGTYKKRGEPYLLVTAVSNTVDEVSASSGYPYKDASEVTADIEKTTFKLFTKGELSWAYDSEQDAKMIVAMKKGKEIVVQGISRVNTSSTDTYSLKGFTAAYDRMKKLCE